MSRQDNTPWNRSYKAPPVDAKKIKRQRQRAPLSEAQRAAKEEYQKGFVINPVKVDTDKPAEVNSFSNRKKHDKRAERRRLRMELKEVWE